MRASMLACFCFCGAVGASTGPSASLLASLVMSSEASAADFRASYCEIFVSNVQVKTEKLATGETVFLPTFTLKILADRLDGPVANVQAVGRPSLVGSVRPPVLKTLEAQDVSSGSETLFTVTLPAFSNVLGTLESWEGAFVVESSTGKKLWANAWGSNADFVVTRYRIEQLAKNSNDPLHDLNPMRCR